MKRFFLAIGFILGFLDVTSAQVNPLTTFAMAGFPTSSSLISDSTYLSSWTFYSDQLGQNYFPTQIDSGFIAFDGNRNFYLIDSVLSADIGSATMRLIATDATSGAPFGVGVVYNPIGVEDQRFLIPPPPVNSDGIATETQATILINNLLRLRSASFSYPNRFTVTQSAHGFVAGNMVAPDSMGWFLANAGLPGDSISLAMIVEVPNSDQFVILADTITLNNFDTIRIGDYLFEHSDGIIRDYPDSLNLNAPMARRIFTFMTDTNAVFAINLNNWRPLQNFGLDVGSDGYIAEDLLSGDTINYQLVGRVIIEDTKSSPTGLEYSADYQDLDGNSLIHANWVNSRLFTLKDSLYAYVSKGLGVDSTAILGNILRPYYEFDSAAFDLPDGGTIIAMPGHYDLSNRDDAYKKWDGVVGSSNIINPMGKDSLNIFLMEGANMVLDTGVVANRPYYISDDNEKFSLNILGSGTFKYRYNQEFPQSSAFVFRNDTSSFRARFQSIESIADTDLPFPGSTTPYLELFQIGNFRSDILIGNLEAYNVHEGLIYIDCPFFSKHKFHAETVDWYIDSLSFGGASQSNLFEMHRNTDNSEIWLRYDHIKLNRTHARSDDKRLFKIGDNDTYSNLNFNLEVGDWNIVGENPRLVTFPDPKDGGLWNSFDFNQNWGGAEFFFRATSWTNSTMNLQVDKYISEESYNMIGFYGPFFIDNTTFNYNLGDIQTKKEPVIIRLNVQNNSTVTIDCDHCVSLEQAALVFDGSIEAGSQVIIRGKYESRGSGYPAIVLSHTGAGDIILQDVTAISVDTFSIWSIATDTLISEGLVETNFGLKNLTLEGDDIYLPRKKDDQDDSADYGPQALYYPDDEGKIGVAPLSVFRDSLVQIGVNPDSLVASDTTTIAQDSIAIYYYLGSEVGRDTIRTPEFVSRLVQDSILVTYKDGIEFARDTIVPGLNPKLVASDTTTLAQDSIIIYYYLGSEIGRDTIRTPEFNARIVSDSVLVYYKDAVEIGRDTIRPAIALDTLFTVSTNGGPQVPLYYKDNMDFDSGDGLLSSRSGTTIFYETYANAFRLADGADQSPSGTTLDDYTFFTYHIALTPSATSDGIVTLPTPSFDLYNVVVRVYCEDNHSTFNGRIVSGTNEIINKGSYVSSIDLVDNQIIQLAAGIDSTATAGYRWFVISDEKPWNGFLRYTVSDTIQVHSKSVSFIDSGAGTITFGIDPAILTPGTSFKINVDHTNNVTFESLGSGVFYTYDSADTTSNLVVSADANIEFTFDGVNFFYELN